MSPLQLVTTVVLLTILTSSCIKGAPIDVQQEIDAPVDEIYYQLFTRKNPTEFQPLFLNDLDALKKSNYNPNADVKFYCPGWGNNGSIGYSAKDEYLLREDVNVFAIDWRSVQNPNLTDANNIIFETGLHTAAFIDSLIDYGTPRSAFHLIGHSAGCHLAGATSSAVSSGKLPRITGLDPARSDYKLTMNEDYSGLSKNDADFVEVVHTNGGTNHSTIAIFDPIGHVDFYANGGQHQPGCQNGHCDHLRTPPLFAESINSQLGFWALRCDTFEDFQEGLCDNNERVAMGDPTPSSARGVFHFTTNGESPFAQG